VTPLLLGLPLSLETLERARFQPRKNYDTNLLEQGLLQFVDGTLVLADETVLQEGTVKGLGNIKALATLIEQQIVEYDFQYYQQTFPVNAGVILLSDGRSMFKNSLHVPLAHQGAPSHFFDEAKFA
jgi:hypothetical protein